MHSFLAIRLQSYKKKIIQSTCTDFFLVPEQQKYLSKFFLQGIQESGCLFLAHSLKEILAHILSVP